MKVKELVAALLEGGPERQDMEIVLPGGGAISGVGDNHTGTKVEITKGWAGRHEVDEPGYYVAARDSQGGVRLRSGQGQLVCNINTPIRTVQGWLHRADPGHFKAMYAAAIELMLSEQEEKSE